MKKIAQLQDNPLLSSTIDSEKLATKMWNDYFSAKHKAIVDNLILAAQKDPSIRAELDKVPNWGSFVNAPTESSLEQLTSTVHDLWNTMRFKVDIKATSAMQAYISQYSVIEGWLAKTSGESVGTTPQAQSATPQKKHTPSPRVKQLQQLLNVTQTGAWNAESNTAFLSWLRANGWDHYISDNKFTGKLDDAIRAMLAEKVPDNSGWPVGGHAPGQPTIKRDDQNSMEDFVGKQSERLERLKKLGV